MSSFQISGRIFALGPMVTGEIREFDVDSSKKEKCQLTTGKYYVRKEYCRRHPISKSPSKKEKRNIVSVSYIIVMSISMPLWMISLKY